MTRVLAALLAFVLLLGSVCANAEPPAVLRRGINITNWFRFPPNPDPAALRGYLDDAAMRDLRRAGFSFVRLPVQPILLAYPGVTAALADAVARLERNGLAVIVVPHPTDWQLETEPADRARLVAFWRSTALMLRRFNPALTFPEVLNEPVFADAPDAWAALQHQVLTDNPWRFCRRTRWYSPAPTGAASPACWRWLRSATPTWCTASTSTNRLS